MRYYHELYIGKSVAPHKEKILKKLSRHKIPLGLYFIALPKNERNQLELYHGALLQQKLFTGGEMIMGFAGEYPEALVLIQQMTQEVYEKTGGTELRKYFLAQEEREKGRI